MTYGELDREADALASFLARQGVQPGDRVALWLQKSTRAVAVMQASLRLGAAVRAGRPAWSYRQDSAGGTGLRASGGYHDAGVRDEAAPARHQRRDALSRGAATGTPDPRSRRGPRGSGLHPVHVRLHRSSQRGMPVTPQRPCFRGLGGRRDRRDRNGPVRQSRATPFRPLRARHIRRVQGRRLGSSDGHRNVVHADSCWSDYLLRRQITVWYSVPSALILMARDGGLLDVPPADFLPAGFALRGRSRSRLSTSGRSATIFLCGSLICTVRRKPMYVRSMRS